jgi:eukaryotic-like serine/threonine-protein kinase
VALTTATKLGPYDLLSLLGAGGMGEVYRGRDARLNREVAIKVLPSSYSSDPERLYRFEQEARAAAALNHPNILSVYDIGRQDGSPYIVSELLEGETLRDRLRSGPLPVRKAVDYAIQIAHGLAAAHEKGIVHRDLKPENIFITKDGRVKILDFGLAKLTLAEPAPATEAATRTLHTEAGHVVGTVGYMSPEQVRGKPADARTDLFSFGAILYEMLSGQRAFRGDTAADTMTAILTKEPPELVRDHAQVPLALDHIVHRCLEKNPEERFHSAHDLSFDLSMLSSTTTAVAQPESPAARKRNWIPTAIAAAALLAIAAGAFLVGRVSAPSAEPPVFHQLTFRRGTIERAAFAPDGHGIVYDAAWDANPPQLFSTRDDSQGSIPLALKKVYLLQVSPTGEMAILLDRQVLGGWTAIGTLARLPIASSAPRPLLENVADIAWSPSGADFAVVRYENQRFRLEYPVGKVLYDTSGWISYPRFSPKGDRIAFLDHPVFGDDRGVVSVVDVAGSKKSLTPVFASEAGLQWSSSGDEIWFTASDSGTNTALLAVTPAGRRRVVVRAPGRMMLQDIARDGRVLLSDASLRRGSFAVGAGEDKEKDVTVLDWNVIADVSADGQYVLSSEQGEGGGPNYSIYLRKTDGSAPTRLGDGNASSLSPDGKWVASTDMGEHPQIYLLPTGAGESRQFTHDQNDHDSPLFFSDGRRIAFTAIEPHGRPRVYVQDLNGGAERAVTPPGFALVKVSPDGHWVLASDLAEKLMIFPVEGGEPQEVRLEKKYRVAGWSEDGAWLYVWDPEDVPGKLYRFNLKSGAREPLRDLAPADAAGIRQIGPVIVTPNGKYYAYGFTRDLADLYVVTGMK